MSVQVAKLGKSLLEALQIQILGIAAKLAI
jgi:hypothetical protein